MDQEYLNQSGDNSVVLKQALREDRASVHRLVTDVQKMASNLHKGFHQLFPPKAAPIERHTETQHKREENR